MSDEHDILQTWEPLELSYVGNVAEVVLSAGMQGKVSPCEPCDPLSLDRSGSQY